MRPTTLLLALAGLASIAPRADADIILSYRISSAGLPAGTMGVLDFQLNTAGGPAQAVMVDVSIVKFANVTFGPTVTNANANSSGGPLPATSITLTNGSPFFAEAMQDVTFGMNGFFILQVIFSGPAVDTPTPGGDPTTFFFSVLDPSLNPLDPPFPAPALELELPAGSNQVVATVNSANIAAVPEPTAWALALGGAALLALAARRGRRAN